MRVNFIDTSIFHIKSYTLSPISNNLVNFRPDKRLYPQYLPTHPPAQDPWSWLHKQLQLLNLKVIKNIKIMLEWNLWKDYYDNI